MWAGLKKKLKRDKVGGPTSPRGSDACLTSPRDKTSQKHAPTSPRRETVWNRSVMRDDDPAVIQVSNLWGMYSQSGEDDKSGTLLKLLHAFNADYKCWNDELTHDGLPYEVFARRCALTPVVVPPEVVRLARTLSSVQSSVSQSMGHFSEPGRTHDTIPEHTIEALFLTNVLSRDADNVEKFVRYGVLTAVSKLMRTLANHLKTSSFPNVASSQATAASHRSRDDAVDSSTPGDNNSDDDDESDGRKPPSTPRDKADLTFALLLANCVHIVANICCPPRLWQAYASEPNSHIRHSMLRVSETFYTKPRLEVLRLNIFKSLSDMMGDLAAQATKKPLEGSQCDFQLLLMMCACAVSFNHTRAQIAMRDSGFLTTIINLVRTPSEVYSKSSPATVHRLRFQFRDRKSVV
eukprot:TRINITY_DN3373_c0_g1_i1.p1 TRINITY_DN3373_c0_g1~~TRINITY_DN3373_c0_g1_i1.p1  ORF type:complete len:407 (+),score=98.37 TRINITY_DN3373_c0_g1_i1:499-1719(+)